MKKHLILCAIVLCSASLFAQDFKVDGICYNFLGGDSVEVTSSAELYTGSVNIPVTVDYNNLTYRVTTIGDYAFCLCSTLTMVAIPNTVTSIGQNAFYQCSSLTEIAIPKNITFIGECAFLGCSVLNSVIWNAKHYTDFTGNNSPFFSRGNNGEDFNLLSQITSFTFGDSVQYIPAYLCGGMTNLSNVTLGKNVRSIGDFAFVACSSLTTITIPNSVTTIGYYAFENCSGLTELTIGNSVTTIGWDAFRGCSSITQTNYTGDLASWCKIRFEGSSSNPTRYSHNLYINGQSLTKADVPEGVTAISQYAFGGLTSLTEVSIPNSVTSIGSYAFESCSNLTAVTIGTGLQNLGYGAFAVCENLTKFICASSQAVEAYHNNIEDYEDGWTGVVLGLKYLDTIVAPAQFFDMTEIYWTYLTKNISYIQVSGGELTPDAFGVINRSFDKLQTLDISAATNTEIANNAFKGCYKLETLLLPSQLERIGYMAVADCKNLQAIDIPATVTDIDDSAFENCRSIETLTFGGQQPASAPAFASEETRIKGVSTSSALQRIGNWAFYNCHELQHLEIPEGVTEIGAAAFYGCTYLEDLTLPATVQAIGDNCFALCSKLNKLTCLATTPPTIEAKTFYDVKRSIPLYVPEASINDYANDTYWGEFVNTQPAPDATTGLLDTRYSMLDTRKVFENGTIYILHNGEKYTIDGRKVE